MKKSVATLAALAAGLTLAAPALAERNAQPSERNGKPSERNARPTFHMDPLNGLVRPNPVNSLVRINPFLSKSRTT
jgi:hypothetical protein